MLRSHIRKVECRHSVCYRSLAVGKRQLVASVVLARCVRTVKSWLISILDAARIVIPYLAIITLGRAKVARVQRIGYPKCTMLRVVVAEGVVAQLFVRRELLVGADLIVCATLCSRQLCPSSWQSRRYGCSVTTSGVTTGVASLSVSDFDLAETSLRACCGQGNLACRTNPGVFST